MDKRLYGMYAVLGLVQQVLELHYMNRTLSLAICEHDLEKEKAEAQVFFKNKYPDIEYIPETDSYKYRGYVFDYFKSGLSITGRPNGYLLVDPDNSRNNWLFDYGNTEERFKEFVSRKERLDKVKPEVEPDSIHHRCCCFNNDGGG